MLWSAGLASTPPPWVLALLVGLVFIWGGLIPLALTLRRGPARRRLFALGGASALAAAAFVSAIFLGRADEDRWPAPRPPRTSPRRVRLLSWNVLHGFPDFVDQEDRTRRLVDLIAQLEPDIVILQESWRTRSHGDLARRLASRLAMGGLFARANGSLRLIGFDEGSALLSRFAMRSSRAFELRPAAGFWDRRVAVRAELEIGPGERWTVFGGHVAYSGYRPERGKAQASFLARAAAEAPGPALVAGDLNGRSGGPRLLPFLAAGFVDLRTGGIDHVLARGLSGWRVGRASWIDDQAARALTGRGRLSNHPAILIDFERRP